MMTICRHGQVCSRHCSSSQVNFATHYRALTRCHSLPRSPRKVVHSRAYANLAEPDLVPAFKAAVEARAFVTDRGAQYRGFVEYAPFQRVPERAKRDPREGTLDAGAPPPRPSARTAPPCMGSDWVAK